MLLSRQHCKFTALQKYPDQHMYLNDIRMVFPNSLYEEYKKEVNILYKQKNNFKLVTTLRLVRLFGKNYSDLLTIADQYYNQQDTIVSNSRRNPRSLIQYFKDTPLIVLDSKNCSFVYINTMLNLTSTQELTNFSSMTWYNPSILQTIPITSNTPKAKIWKTVKRHVKLSLVKILTRYTTLPDKFDSAFIRDLAEYILEYNEEYNLTYAKTPRQFLEMYSNGPGGGSCMTTHKEKTALWAPLLKAKHHPMSIFSYHEHIKGVYTIKDTKIKARTLLYDFISSSGKTTTYYGRIFAENKQTGKKFIAALHRENYMQLNENYTTHTKSLEVYKFKIPGIKYGCTYITPLPYFDNIHKIYVKFLSLTKEFEIQIGNNLHNVNTKSTKGYIAADDLTQEWCYSCGSRIKNNTDKIIHTTTRFNRVFCNYACLNTTGYGLARDRYGDIKVIPNHTIYYDPFSSNIKCGYTKINVIKILHCALPYIYYIDTDQLHLFLLLKIDLTYEWFDKIFCYTDSNKITAAGVNLKMLDYKFKITSTGANNLKCALNSGSVIPYPINKIITNINCHNLSILNNLMLTERTAILSTKILKRLNNYVNAPNDVKF